ncbi:threonine synthase [Microbaculum marinisediminis]|uniref:Threonine synthase n=1 Tax=Microbaculum marinisediminis TaxID=2931392 RepID=A0AAW5QS97_9HYPH|nr:threonine synthase [Microbaculum sp. A6E488]MCT8970344.1 threonine synthase [Microbaculum sp. A6E488]
MRYVSTRGQAPVLDFADVLLTGLAADGGLYVPETWPVMSKADIAALAGLSYPQVAERIIAPFVGDAIAPAALRAMIADAYAQFRHPAVAPLVQTGPNDWVLELFHGPTLAFKDVAMLLLARLMDHVLEERGARATIVGATSGDTGGAAIEAFRGRARTDVFILFPDGRVSDVQRRQMTTASEDNVHALALSGNFDDCQAIVKGLFNDSDFRRQVALSGVNSINWARIVAQVVYYFTSAVALGAPHRPVGFTVPTGNFGDIFAGYVAARMGLPIDRLVIATNVNDILARTLETGRYEVRSVLPTTSPSMDIQVSSNFERLLFETSGRDAGAVNRWMDGLKQSGSFTLDDATLSTIRRHFDAARTDEAECAATIKRVLDGAGYLADPHTAVGIAAARKVRIDAGVPMITLSTAHPAKFPDAVEAAAGIRPALPAWLADLHERRERFERLPAETAAVAAHIRKATRVVAEGVE